jgi:hypothetical protein
MHSKTVWIIADHGLAIVYFLQSHVIKELKASGANIVLLTDDSLKEKIADRFQSLEIQIEGLKLSDARASASYLRDIQWWLQFLRRVGGSRKINTGAMDSYIEQVSVEEPTRRRIFMPLARLLIGFLRRSRIARRSLVRLQEFFTFNLYSDLFEKYEPDLIISSTPGWRLDRYLLREAAARGVPRASVIVGWDNPSSYSLPGVRMDYVTCWSEVQKEELVKGSDWPEDRVNIGGIPTYDGYITKKWVIPREAYFAQHGLDPQTKLLSYACSFISFSPNLQNIEALIEVMDAGELKEPTQLLIRLHPNHFMDVHLFANEREQIRHLARSRPDVHIVEPIPLGGTLGYYSGEDMPEKASMLTHSDVFLTVYSTMVVEAALHDRPVISVCIDSLKGWEVPRKYSLPLSEIGNWPTHDRFRCAGAGQVAASLQELQDAINRYLMSPGLDREARNRFIESEITFTDGSAGRRTGEFLCSLLT